ncbi:MAG: methyl-accepting chemotaxis protein [Thermincolia bacterium]
MMKLRGKISVGYWVLAGMVVFVIISGLIALNLILTKYQYIVNEEYPALVRTVQAGQVSVNEFKAIEERINQDKEIARLIGQGLNTVMPIFMLLAIGGGAWAAIGVPRRIAKPVVELAEVSSRIARGDLTVDVKIETDCEIGQLGETFSYMVKNLRELVEKINKDADSVARTSHVLAQVSDEVAKASQQISGAIINVAEGNIQQSEKIQETLNIIGQLVSILNSVVEASREQEETVRQAATIINQMVEGVNNIADNTQVMVEVASETAETASKGGRAVEDTIDGMERIRATVWDSASHLKALGEKSQQIGEIVTVINKIAEQTNLLALNAAIEAARAGEQGKGFAVVADEVRKLAEGSGRAAKEISRLIESMQIGTNDAIKAMESGTREVDKGAALASEARVALEAILSGIVKTNDQVQGISAAAEEVTASGSEVVNSIKIITRISKDNLNQMEGMIGGGVRVEEAVRVIATVAQETGAGTQQAAVVTKTMTASTEEIAASSQELAHMAVELKELLKGFNTTGNS